MSVYYYFVFTPVIRIFFNCFKDCFVKIDFGPLFCGSANLSDLGLNVVRIGSIQSQSLHFRCNILTNLWLLFISKCCASDTATAKIPSIVQSESSESQPNQQFTNFFSCASKLHRYAEPHISS